MNWLDLSLELPVTDPTWIFLLVLLIILFAPILLTKLRIPHIIGMILAGLAIGEHGFNILVRDSSFELFGKVGVYYIMFLAGLEMNMADFKKNRGKAVALGLLAFIIPISIGMVTNVLLLKYSLITSILLASMYASHTLVAYPIVSSYYTEQHQSQVHTQYQEVVEKADGEELATARAEAEAYNELLASGAAAAELDALDYDSLLNLAGNGIMGYIEIPAIDVLLPIYHGVGEDSLERGAGHMPSTSLTIGGRGTHAVISAHSGMATARMFTDLEQLEAGDVFYLHVLNEALSYEVDQILVVKPYQIDALKIDREQDYVTLITCTPYGVNSHRLLVRGHRIEQEAEENVSNEIASPRTEPKQSTWMAKYWEGIRDGLILFLIVFPAWLAIMLLVKKRRGRKRP